MHAWPQGGDVGHFFIGTTHDEVRILVLTNDKLDAATGGSEFWRSGGRHVFLLSVFLHMKNSFLRRGGAVSPSTSNGGRAHPGSLFSLVGVSVFKKFHRGGCPQCCQSSNKHIPVTPWCKQTLDSVRLERRKASLVNYSSTRTPVVGSSSSGADC